MSEEAVGLLDQFVQWFENQNIGAQFDDFVAAHAQGCADWSPDGEQAGAVPRPS